MSVTPTQPAWTPVYVPWIYVSPSGRQWVYAHVQREPDGYSVTVWRRQGRYQRAVYPTLADARTATDAMAAACAAAGWTDVDRSCVPHRGWVIRHRYDDRDT